jgi:hypothetical protein
MFYAYVVACSMFTGCMGFNDNRGPYDTITACEARVEEMTEFLGGAVRTRQMPPDLKIADSGCKKGSFEGEKVEGIDT